MAIDNGWDEHRLLVLDALKRIEGKQDTLGTHMDEVKADLLVMKTKNKVAGYFGGLVAGTAASLGVAWISKKFGM